MDNTARNVWYYEWACVCLEPSTASFLLPADLSGLHLLKAEVGQGTDAIALCACDAEYVEVTLKGIWLASSESAEGIFVTAMSHSIVEAVAVSPNWGNCCRGIIVSLTSDHLFADQGSEY